MILVALMAAALAAPPRQYTEAEIADLKRTESGALMYGSYREECHVGYTSGLKPLQIALLLGQRVQSDMALGLTADELRATEPPGDCHPLPPQMSPRR